MHELATFCKTLKTRFSPRNKSPTQLVSCWSEPDVLNNTLVNAFVLILRTQGCSWAHESGCSMCGYFNDSYWDTVSDDQLLAQFQQAMTRYKNEPIVKIFTSGSFFDDSEISPHVQTTILQQLAGVTKKISVESRPTYVTNETLGRHDNILSSSQLEIGIGLETANDFIREHTINKGFTYQEYTDAATCIKNHDMLLKTYVLIKPPFLTEQETIQDVLTTVRMISSTTDMISFNPTNIQKNTLVEYLWKRHHYRPPWLWTICKILQDSTQITNIPLKCDVVAGGTSRGAHNCGTCDHTLLKQIQKFSLTQDPSVFTDVPCECKQTWRDQCDLENLSFGSHIDFCQR